MELKLIGSNTSNGMKILKNIKKFERQENIILNVVEIPTAEKEKYNIKIVPTLIINDKIISQGNIISERDLKNFIKPLITEV